MTTDNFELYAAIIRHPKEDTPRLMYADWLDENAREVPCGACGGSGCQDVHEHPPGSGRFSGAYHPCRGTGKAGRAEFIRVQVELAGVKCARVMNPCTSPMKSRLMCPNCQRGCALRRRERELLDAHWVEWWGFPADVTSGEPPVFRRGFVDEVRCDLAALFGGGPCEFCEGRGNFQRSGSYAECPRCLDATGKGTGRTPGIAAELFAAHPVTRVVLTDREPYWNGGAYCYYRRTRDYPSHTVNSAAVLPDELFDAGPPVEHHRKVGRDRARGFDTVAAANDWLSAACVALGRERAGLEPLP